MKNIGNTIPGLDVGAMVRRCMFEKGMSKARVARKLNRDHRTVRNIIYNSSMQTYLVWELGAALQHNFFADLAQQFRTACPEADRTHPDELAALKQELEQLRSERDYLRKAIDMLGG